MRHWLLLLAAWLSLLTAGCAGLRHQEPVVIPDWESDPELIESGFVDDASILTVLADDELDELREGRREVPSAEPNDISPPVDSELLPTPEAAGPIADQISLDDVILSIRSAFPALEAAYLENEIAAGKQLAASGAFDMKLKGSSENGPVGFYETYRQKMGFTQPFYHGGEFFSTYRIGRGEFQPWYLERQTNDGGEFKAGLNVPLLANRTIDSRRADLWRATYDRQRVAPEVQSMLIQFVRDGSITYWQWVAAGQKYQIGLRALELARRRNAQLKRKVEVGAVDPPVLQDNLRAIAQREAKLIDLRRKFEQASFKLSIFYRTQDGTPLVPDESRIADFSFPGSLVEHDLNSDIGQAFTMRPELAAVDASIRRVNVDLAEARNDMLPVVNAELIGSQDVGGPTSSKRDKSPFELEAGIFVDVPLQRRKARGKLTVARAKLSQLAAKRRFMEDKIRAELQSADAALAASFERLDRADESRQLAESLASIEERKFEAGESDLFSVVLREQIAIEAAEAEVDALLEYYSARAEYNAAMGREWPE